jgi:hypothetical protein
MNKNILLGGIIVVGVLYIIYINYFEKLETSTIENLVNTVVPSKYQNKSNREETKTPLHHISSMILYLPTINHGINLHNYELYHNIKSNIVYWIGKKKVQKDNIGGEKKNNSNVILSTLENYYQYAKKGMVNIVTNGSKNEKDWTVENDKSIIENIDSGNPAPKSDDSNLYDGKQNFELNIILWVCCLLISFGIIFVIVRNGESAIKSMKMDKISKIGELSSDNSSELNTSDNPIGGSGNDLYYIGGYDSNLYSE